MSAFMVSDDCITAILLRIDERDMEALGYGYEDYEKTDYAGKYNVSIALGRAMRKMNAQALYYRYNEPTRKRPEFHPTSLNITRISLTVALKQLQCYLYQCSEGKVPSKKLYRDLRELEKEWACRIVRRTHEYQAAEWGI